MRSVASNMIGHKLITKQTGAAGRPCNMARLFSHTQAIINLNTPTRIHRRTHAHTPTLTPNDQVLVMEKMNIIKEYYFAIMMDRASQVFHMCLCFYLCSLFSGPRPVHTSFQYMWSYWPTPVHKCLCFYLCSVVFWLTSGSHVPSSVLCLAPS